MPPMRFVGSVPGVVLCVLLIVTGSGCVAGVRHGRPYAAGVDFFPLGPGSSWEYLVSRRADAAPLRFTALVRPTEFAGPHGQACRIVDERYGDRPSEEPTPVVYCAEGGYLHRVMALEYRGESLEDTGMRSGELNFLPVNLAATPAWEGRTIAYQLPDGSGYEVRQMHQVYTQREPIDVPAGRFEHCARVETTAVHSATSPGGTAVGPRIVYYYSDWYAPGVGLVRTEQRSATAEVLATVELMSFRVAPEAKRP